MTMPVIVLSHLSGEIPFTSDRWDTTTVECVDDESYGRALAEAWATNRTVVNVEHDVEISDDLIADLLDCPHPLCAHPYLVYAVSGIHDAPAYPFCVTNPGPWVTEGTEWAAWGAPGFMKVTPQGRYGPLPVRHWLGVEAAVNARLTCRWHLHWPAVEHYHQ